MEQHQYRAAAHANTLMDINYRSRQNIPEGIAQRRKKNRRQLPASGWLTAVVEIDSWSIFSQRQLTRSQCIDNGCRYRSLQICSVVCLSACICVSHDCGPCKIGWTDPDGARDVYFGGLNVCMISEVTTYWQYRISRLLHFPYPRW